MKDEGGRMTDIPQPGSGPRSFRNTELRGRTKSYALRIIQLVTGLPRTQVAQVLGRQVLRSGTSPGAQYREAHRAKSMADFISKIEGALQELDETAYWLELLVESGTVDREQLDGLDRETEELTAIFVSIVHSAKRK
ncbi:MAG: four helix bundle protein [Actinomycetota bacterium]